MNVALGRGQLESDQVTIQESRKRDLRLWQGSVEVSYAKSMPGPGRRSALAVLTRG